MPSHPHKDLALEYFRRGILTIAEDGSIWRTLFLTRGNRVRPMDPRRADILHKDGYSHVRLGRHGTICSHVFVWLCLAGDIPDGFEVNHKDGNRSRNILSNLELLTTSGNLLHSYRVLGRRIRSGEEINTHKLTNMQRLEVLDLLRVKLPKREIARRYKISPTAVRLIAKRSGEQFPEVRA